MSLFCDIYLILPPILKKSRMETFAKRPSSFVFRQPALPVLQWRIPPARSPTLSAPFSVCPLPPRRCQARRRGTRLAAPPSLATIPSTFHWLGASPLHKNLDLLVQACDLRPLHKKLDLLVSKPATNRRIRRQRGLIRWRRGRTRRIRWSRGRTRRILLRR
jgi:hypothetical protein